MNTFSIRQLTAIFLSLFLVLGCQDSFIEPTVVCTNDPAITMNASHPKAAKIQAKIEEYIAIGVPGISVLISDDSGLWLATGGYADLENQIPMQPCHINKLGSITKMMVGTLVWQLIQDGTLGIDEPMSKYLPEVANRITNGNEITLKMLINHTSGVYDVAGDIGYNLAVINDYTKSWTAEEILNFIENKTPTNAPGEAVNYSNSNTMLVSMIIEAATGRKHSDLLKERIFEPLGMNNTVYFNYATDFPLANLAQGYLDFNNDGKDVQNISNLNPGSGNGYTGVYSSVTDLYKFMNALLREKTLITPANLLYIFDNMVAVEGNYWQSSPAGIHDEYKQVVPEGVHAYGHSGGDIGYTANLNYFPHNNTIFAASYNYGTALPSPLGDKVYTLREELIAIMAE